MAKYRIIAFDGGGIRGLITAILLERLEAEVPGWLDQANLLAGASTGGLIALGLAKGLRPHDLRGLYERKGDDIFDDSWLDDLRDLGRIAGAEYDNTNLAREVCRILGTTRLKDLQKRILIPAFDLDNEDPDPNQRSWKPKFFHNFPGVDSDGELPAVKVALYTTAAPTYFPTVDGYIDGGIVANNPSMAALAQTQDRRVFSRPPRLDEVALLSLSTGRALFRVEGSRLDWGFAQWARPLVSIMIEGSMGIADYQCRQLLNDNYFRLNPLNPINQAIQIDDVRKLPDLVAFASTVDLDETVAWINRRWL
jgi:patatin-like phospholipase/acyl hydrolase